MIILGFTFIIAIYLILIIKKKYLNFIYITITLLLAIIAFHLDPVKAYYSEGNYLDLLRFYNVLDNTRIGGYGYLLQHSDYSKLFIIRWYVYIMSLFKSNGVLPAFTSILEYGLIFYIINSFAKKNESSKLTIALSTSFFLLTIDFVNNISNIRTPLVFCIYFLCIYKEFIEHKKSKNFWIIYILLCFIHQIAILLLLFRVIVIFYNKYTSKIINVSLLLWSLIYNAFIPLVSKVSSNLYIAQLTSKLNYYDNVSEHKEILLILLSYTKIILSITILIYFTQKLKPIIKKEYHDFYILFKIITLCSIGSFFQYHMFLRLPILLTYFLIIFIQINFGNTSNLKLEKNMTIRLNHILQRNIYCLLIILICGIYVVYYFMGYNYQRIIF